MSIFPYRMRHVPTGYYYKPGTINLSKKGKVYTTAVNGISIAQPEVTVAVRAGTPIASCLEELGYELRKSYTSLYLRMVKIPKTEFVLEPV